MTYNEFKNKYNGRQVKHQGGGALKGSCWDLAAYYFEEVLSLTTYNLNELMYNLNTTGKFEEVKSTSMISGDICIWQSDHVCIFDSWDGKTCFYLSQDLNGRPTGVYSTVTYSIKQMRVFRLKVKILVKDITIGDIVLVNGYGTAGSDGSGKHTRVLSSEKAKVIRTNGLPQRPYGLNFTNANWVDGWFRKEDIKKY